MENKTVASVYWSISLQQNFTQASPILLFVWTMIQLQSNLSSQKTNLGTITPRISWKKNSSHWQTKEEKFWEEKKGKIL